MEDGQRPVGPAQHRHLDLDVMTAMAVGGNPQLHPFEAGAVVRPHLALEALTQDVVQGAAGPGNESTTYLFPIDGKCWLWILLQRIQSHLGEWIFVKIVGGNLSRMKLACFFFDGPAC
mgnify:CR=1 FL=1